MTETTKQYFIESHSGGNPVTEKGIARIILGMRWTDLENIARSLDANRCGDFQKSKCSLTAADIHGWAESVWEFEEPD